MSLTKKDPSFCVAANDPHLVSLGGGRLSTAVTIHNIPIGDTTIGSSTRCSISLNGTGIRPVHCTIYRSEENEVTLVPERDARILIDGHKIDDEVNLTQGAMITIGKSYYLRFNNPAEAQQIRTAMGSNERISMPQLDFAQERQRHSNKSCNSTTTSSSSEITNYQIDSFYETTIQPSLRQEEQAEKSFSKTITTSSQTYNNLLPIDINGFQCPKVFTADLVTVNMPAKDVLGQKYQKFAQNLAENQRNEKNLNNAWHNAATQKQINNTMKLNGNIYDNIPINSKVLQQEGGNTSSASSSKNNDYLVKLKNAHESHKASLNAYDRYPKLGNMQIFPMTTINNEINTTLETKECNGNIPRDEKVHLDDMLKICSEYTDRQNQNQNQNSSNSGSMNSSPIVQNRIKTNGSLPREKKSPFHNELSGTALSNQPLKGSLNNLSSNSHDHSANTSNYSTGYENVRLVAQNRIEVNGQLVSSPKSSYENVVIGKYVPQSPRTKIRTNCMSPKRDQTFAGMFAQQKTDIHAKANKQQEFDDLLKTFGEKLQQEIQNIEECSRYQPPKPANNTSTATPAARSNKNINNLKLNLKQPSSLQNSPKPTKKPAPAPRTLLKSGNNHAGGSLPHLAGASSPAQHEEVRKDKNNVRKSDFDGLSLSKQELENILDMLQDKIHRLEAQRNATRVMEENQQAKLKQSIEMKMDQVKKLKDMLKQKPNNECLKEELKNISESLDNDRKQFEDLEFQYLEEESEWHAYHEELKSEEKILLQQIADKDKELQHSSTATSNPINNNNKASETNSLNRAKNHSNKSKQHNALNKPYDIGKAIGIMSQSLFGSAEILCPKRNTEDVMSKSVNENMFFNNKIEFGSSATATSSTPKRAQLQIVNIDEDQLTQEYKDDSISKSCESFTQGIRFNLSLGSDDFEVNPLEKRIPSQDDIDRISKVTTDNPISSQGATTKIFDSIKEIERNRQLLLAQQGHHVIEHERQKMNDLKKKMHSEARAQYLSMINNKTSTDATNNTSSESQSSQKQQQQQQHTQQQIQLQQLKQQQQQHEQEHPLMDKENQPNVEKLLPTTTARNSQNSTTKRTDDDSMGQQRHSQPEFETSQRHYVDQQKRHSANSRPLSEANSENGCDTLAHQNTSKSNMELSTNNTAAYALDEKRFSTNSNDGHILGGSQQKLRHKDSSDPNERKRVLPKHQRPLTRYLPIFSPDLDLRLHIESAGHQIALCPHVFVDATSCRGYLHKLGATFHGWSKRWFVLDRQRNAFIYYSDKLERKPRGGAYFSTIDEVYLDHLNVSKSGRPHCTFIVKTKKRSYQLQAASDAAARIWIDAIITGAQGNLDY